MTGLDQRVVALLPPADQGLLYAVAVLVITTMVIGTFMSNTAAANLLLPIGISSAAAFGAGSPAVQIALSIALAASVSMSLPVSTPPNAMAYATGEITTRDMARAGIMIGIVSACLIILLGGPVLRFWGIPH